MSYCVVEKIVRSVAFFSFQSLDGKNTIDSELIESTLSALENLPDSCSVVVVKGYSDVFCSGVDIDVVVSKKNIDQNTNEEKVDPDRLYELWRLLRFGRFITIAHVSGATTAGGVGFVAACDLVVADTDATFALSEMLFDVFPACVLPFLITRVGSQRANELVLSCRRFNGVEAQAMGLVDYVSEDSTGQLRQLIVRVGRHSVAAVQRYKQYQASFPGYVDDMRSNAIDANRAMFLDPQVLANFEAFRLRKSQNESREYG